ncbi:putative pentatricopeptide repeat-containing protein At5g59200, chloroplastic [Actinidia eriantha]|uniref:putative pentatricopeptide repeat-containing protein At5g59200, chloroplastic n=1 Tax=Actinidia eriantha TaxID=165200 RepID=UPI00258F095E|nr:putative pentatricopeptide repeat-containing protein At5g59200, chloroplastic [Actinidia eriantha]
MGTINLAVVGNSPFPPNSNPNSRSKNVQKRKRIIFQLQKCKNINQITPIHAQIIRNGHEQDPFIVFELLRVCSNFNSIDYASKIFQRTQNPNVYLYTALIDGFVKSGFYIDGIRVYSQMIERCVTPDNYAITSVLKACGSQLALTEGREIHAQALKLNLSSIRSVRMKLVELYGKCGEFGDAWQVFDEMPERNFVASTVMISCYVDYGLVEEARSVFDRVKTKDTVCWTAMIDGFVRNGEMNRALELFRDMQREGVRPNEVTIVCVSSACSQLATLELGRWVHSYVGKYGIELNHFVGSALINMYLRCGSVDEAKRVFEGLKERDVTTYNSMISGLALNGKSTKAVELFQDMERHGVRPTNVTFVGVLNACSHGGMVELGFQIFETMTKKYKIEPQIEHYGCMVDLLGRVGRLEEAYNFIRSMKQTPDHIIWGALLSACQIHRNFDLGEKVAQILLDCGNADSGTYVLLSSVYASSGKWEQAAQVRAKMKASGIRKEPGFSSIEVKNEIHEFLLGDTRHHEREAIYRKLKEMGQILRLKEGYEPEIGGVLQDIEDDEKEWAVTIHSERLAVCYGLISTEPCTTIRVVKNLRVCNDCHLMLKLIAKVTRRRIVVRDRNRFHHFENGICSCGDYW